MADPMRDIKRQRNNVVGVTATEFNRMWPIHTFGRFIGSNGQPIWALTEGEAFVKDVGEGEVETFITLTAFDIEPYATKPLARFVPVPLLEAIALIEAAAERVTEFIEGYSLTGNDDPLPKKPATLDDDMFLVHQLWRIFSEAQVKQYETAEDRSGMSERDFVDDQSDKQVKADFILEGLKQQPGPALDYYTEEIPVRSVSLFVDVPDGMSNHEAGRLASHYLTLCHRLASSSRG